MHPKPTLYYDGACPVCSREVAMYRRQPGAQAVCWVDASSCDAAELGEDLSRDAAMSRLYLRLPDGQLVSGAAAFAALWQSLPRVAWLGRLLGARPFVWVAEAFYRFFLLLRPVWRKPASRRQ